MSSAHPSNMRHELTAALVDPVGQLRAVVEIDNQRVDQLIAGPYIDETKMVAIGRQLLTKVGLYDPTAPGKPEHQWQESNAELAAKVHEELDQSREVIRNSSVNGAHDAAVDHYIGLRDKESLLPQLFRDLHHQAELDRGKELTFLDWMANYATDAQLLNTWQWHDEYLKQADADPAFVEKVANVKQGYARGIETAVQTGELHKDMYTSKDNIAEMQIVHASPFSPAAVTVVHAHPESKRILVSRHYDGNEAVLYHELTHLTKPGFVSLINEAATDRIAASVYDHAHPNGPRYTTVHDSPYEAQHEVLKSADRISGGKIGLYELSHHYAGDSAVSNTLKLSDVLEEVTGIPLLQKAILQVYKASDGLNDVVTADILTITQQKILRDTMSLFADYFESGVPPISSPEDMKGLISQLFKMGLADARYSERVLNALEVAKLCYADMERANVLRRGE